MRPIRAGKWLACGCCGDGFTTWAGYVDQDQDDGFGICKECQELIHERDEQEWDRAINTLRSGLTPGNQVTFDALDRGTQKAVVLQALEDGILTFTVGRE